MKKLAIVFFVAGLLSSCAVFNKKPKVGCPVSARNTGAENAQLDSKQKKKDRYKGGDKYNY